jgi:hypothetical protein
MNEHNISCVEQIELLKAEVEGLKEALKSANYLIECKEKVIQESNSYLFNQHASNAMKAIISNNKVFTEVTSDGGLTKYALVAIEAYKYAASMMIFKNNDLNVWVNDDEDHEDE